MPTESSNILPASDGLDLGSPSQRWDANLRNVVVTGNLTVSGSQTNHALPQLNVLDYGADNDAGYYPNCRSGNGSKTLNNVFHVGRAPKAGDTLIAGSVGVAGTDLVTTVVSYNESTHVLVMADAASITLSQCGAVWGTDSTAGIQSAIDTAYNQGGGTIVFPVGHYLVSNVNLSAAVGPNKVGRISLVGMGGRQATVLIGIGASQSAIIAAPASSVPLTVNGLNFESYDQYNKTQIAVSVLGGTEHCITDCYFGNLYEGIRFANTWLNWIYFNRFYGCTYAAVHFGPAGSGAVNATLVIGNEFGAYGSYGLLSDSSGGGGSQQNTYAWNSFEGTNMGSNNSVLTVADIKLNDAASRFVYGYSEMSVPGGGTYNLIVGGSYNRIDLTYNIGMQVTGSSNVISCSYVTGNIPSQTYAVKTDGSRNIFYGYSAANLSSPSSQVLMGSLTNPFYAGYTQMTSYAIGGTADWPYGRFDICGIPFGRSNSNNSNPSAPTQFGAAAFVPAGTIIGNVNYRYGPVDPQGRNPFWVNNADATGAPTNLSRIEAHGKIRQEATAAPTGNTWTQGDFLWNTAPAEAGSAGSKYVIVGWICTVGGTPGTWLQCRALTGN